VIPKPKRQRKCYKKRPICSTQTIESKTSAYENNDVEVKECLAEDIKRRTETEDLEATLHVPQHCSTPSIEPSTSPLENSPEYIVIKANDWLVEFNSETSENGVDSAAVDLLKDQRILRNHMGGRFAFMNCPVAHEDFQVEASPHKSNQVVRGGRVDPRSWRLYLAAMKRGLSVD
jgi:hypothetical protein